MDAKNRVACPLRVEWLESRCLLSSADALTPGALAALVPHPAVGSDPRTVRAAESLESLLTNALKLTAQNGNETRRNDGDETVFLTSAVSALGDLHSIRVESPGAGAVERLFDIRDKAAEIRAIALLVRDELRESFPRERPGVVPTNQPDPPTAPGSASESRPELARVPADPTSAFVAASPTRVNGEAPGAVDVPNAPTPAPESNRTATAPSAPTDTDPPAPDAWVLPGAAALVVEALPPDWRSVLLDPLAGIPVEESATLNLAALGTEAEAFFAHLAQLGPEWSADLGWGEYLCLAASVLLVGGSAYFARGASPMRTSGLRVLPEPPEEVP
jgi:hypothetical protein